MRPSEARALLYRRKNAQERNDLDEVKRIDKLISQNRNDWPPALTRADSAPPLFRPRTPRKEEQVGRGVMPNRISDNPKLKVVN